MVPEKQTRRQALATLSTVPVAALAGCLGGDDSNNSSGESGSFRVRWAESLGVERYYGPGYDAAVTDNGLFVGHTSGVTALGADGERRWTGEQFQEFVSVEAADGTVVTNAGSDPGTQGGFELAAFDAQSGDLRWSAQPELDISTGAQMTVGEEHVAVFDLSGLVVFDATSGEQVTTGPGGNDLYLTKDVVAVADESGGVVGIDPETGTQLYDAGFDLELGYRGALADGQIVAPLVQGYGERLELVGVDIDSGELRWQTTAPGVASLTGPAGSDDLSTNGSVFTVYEVTFEDGVRVVGLDPNTGERRWTSDSIGDGDVPSQTPAIDEDTVVAPLQEGDRVAALDAETGERSAEASIDDSATFRAHDGVLYRCDTEVTAYDI